MSDRMLAALFVPEAILDRVADRAWLQAMLDFEAALAQAQAWLGLAPAAAADEIALACRADLFDPAWIGREGRHAGTPVEPLVRALVSRVPESAAPYVHRGATSQDVIDTASMLVVRRTVTPLIDDLDDLMRRAAELTEEHRASPMVGRTFLQHAVPITFGLKSAGWLSGLLDARRRLDAVMREDLALQLGGAAGTLAALGDDGPAVVRQMAEILDLPPPSSPWHTSRGKSRAIAAALAIAASAVAKVATDVALLAQPEVAEVGGDLLGGASSAMPHKRNPTASMLVLACQRRVQALTPLVLGSVHEHERALGAWQAEWVAMSDLLAFTAGAVAAARELLDSLEVDPERMRTNLELSGGRILAEAIARRLAESLGKTRADDVVRRAAADTSRSFEEALQTPDVLEHLTPAAIAEALDAPSYLGASQTFIDAVLSTFRAEIQQ